MKKWYKYYLEKDSTIYNKTKSFTTRLDFTNYELDQVHSNAFDKLFDFKFFHTDYHKPIFDYLVSRIKGKVISIGSGRGHLEYHLSKKIKDITATDINESFISNNKKVKFKYLDILDKSKIQLITEKYDTIFIPGIIYLFDDKQLKVFFENLKYLLKSDGNIYLCFRSKYSTFINFIDHFICPIEIYLKKIIYFFIKRKKSYVVKSYHGFRRRRNNFEKNIKEYFKIISTYKDLYETEYNRSIIINRFKLSKILGFLFFRSHPYLHIYHLKKIV